MIFAKPSGAQTKTTYRSFEKSSKLCHMEEKKTKTKNDHETSFLMSI